jgi:hypothetical protein
MTSVFHRRLAYSCQFLQPHNSEASLDVSEAQSVVPSAIGYSASKPRKRNIECTLSVCLLLCPFDLDGNLQARLIKDTESRSGCRDSLSLSLSLCLWIEKIRRINGSNASLQALEEAAGLSALQRVRETRGGLTRCDKARYHS